MLSRLGTHAARPHQNGSLAHKVLVLERYDPYGSELTFASPRSRGPVRPGQRLSTRRRVRPENEGNLASVRRV
jgi:hypothetical protein